MVASRGVVQGCSNRRNKGNRLRVQPTEREIPLWVQFVRNQCENFFPQPQAKFVICLVHLEENCFTRAFDTTQRRQLKPGSLPSIWGRKEPSTERDSTRQSRTKEKERRKLRSLWVLLMFGRTRKYCGNIKKRLEKTEGRMGY